MRLISTHGNGTIVADLFYGAAGAGGEVIGRSRWDIGGELGRHGAVRVSQPLRISTIPEYLLSLCMTRSNIQPDDALLPLRTIYVMLHAGWLKISIRAAHAACRPLLCELILQTCEGEKKMNII